MVSDLARTGGGRLVAVACVGGDGQPLMPCGRCRQLLWEHGGADMLIETVSLGIVPMREVLPDAFGPEDLRRRGGAGRLMDAIDVLRTKRDGGELSAGADPLGDRRLHARRRARRADERAAHGGLLPRHVAGRAGRLDPGDDRLRRAQGPLLAGPADRRQALDRRRRRQDHAAARAAGRRLRRRRAAAVRPRARATPAARWTSWRRSPAGGPTCTRRPTSGSCARSAR